MNDAVQTGEMKSNGRAPAIAKDAKIKVLVTENPKRAHTHAYSAFAVYRDGMTVDEAITAGAKRSDINYDVVKGYISVE